MFFPEHLRKIYTHELLPDKSFDPLLVDRMLVVESNNNINTLIAMRNGAYTDLGDVSVEGKKQSAIDSAKAEIELTRIARCVFSFPQETLSAVVLEVLYDYMGWMEGKGQRAGMPSSS